MITLISAALIRKGCHVIQSPVDADVDIVKATVNDPVIAPQHGLVRIQIC